VSHITPLTGDLPTTGVLCPDCSRPVAVIDNVMPDGLSMRCSAGNHQWSTPLARPRRS